MAIWGHERVLVEKDTVARVWHVRTTSNAHLVTIPWTDAFKSFPHARDYQEAIWTCQADDDMRLTPQERAEVLKQVMPQTAPATPPPLPPPDNVLVVDFKRKRRL